ncbi:MAG: hypothetical protein R3F49_03310 [Planctomycetota bacterium]
MSLFGIGGGALAGCSPVPATDAGGHAGGAGASKVDIDQLLPKDLPISEEARQMIGDLVATMQPIDPTLTSNFHDQQFQREKALIERLEKGPKEIGWAALHAFTNYPERDFKVRRNLLRVGAHAAPEEAKALLEFLSFNYGPYIEDRTEACLLFAEVAPERFMELARPFIVRRDVLHQTLPDDEFLVQAWNRACTASGISPVPVMADVATNLMMQPYARVIAIRTLAANEITPESRAALQTCLIESMGDGLIRRTAAQSILANFPREDACALLREVRAREADINMADFLDEMIQENCK